jgi:hypothetical protein
MLELITIRHFVREYNAEYYENTALQNLKQMDFTKEEYTNAITKELETSAERLIIYMFSNNIPIDTYLSVFITDEQLLEQIDQIVEYCNSYEELYEAFEANFAEDFAKLTHASLSGFQINPTRIVKTNNSLKFQLNMLYQKELNDIIVFYTLYKDSAFLLENINTFIEIIEYVIKNTIVLTPTHLVDLYKLAKTELKKRIHTIIKDFLDDMYTRCGFIGAYVNDNNNNVLLRMTFYQPYTTGVKKISTGQYDNNIEISDLGTTLGSGQIYTSYMNTQVKNSHLQIIAKTNNLQMKNIKNLSGLEKDQPCTSVFREDMIKVCTNIDDMPIKINHTSQGNWWPIQFEHIYKKANLFDVYHTDIICFGSYLATKHGKRLNDALYRLYVAKPTILCLRGIMKCSVDDAVKLIDCLEESEEQKTTYRSCISNGIFVNPKNAQKGGSYITIAGRRRKIQIKKGKEYVNYKSSVILVSKLKKLENMEKKKHVKK